MDHSEEDETIYVATTRVFCDGARGPLGHPGVYLNIGHENQIICPYCSQRFEIDKNFHSINSTNDED